MTAETLHLASAPRRATIPASAFAAALILVTVLPLAAIAVASFHPVVIPAAALLAVLGSTHVFATFYLLTDPDIRDFVRAHPIRMIVAPVLLVGGGAAAFSLCDGTVFAGSILLFFLYQAWHFGSQNIGVASFVSLSDRGRPLSTREKRIIRAGIVVGMLGVLKAMAPDYIVGANHMPIPAPVAASIDLAYRLGCVAAPALTAVALWLAVQAWWQGRQLYAMTIFLAVTFLFPMYLSRDFVLGYVSFATAHGLQYLVFLGSHSLNTASNADASRRQPRIALMLAPGALAGFLVAAWGIWTLAPTLHPAPLPMLGMSLILSITLAHFWVDRYLWRMKDGSRAAWIRARFGYVLS